MYENTTGQNKYNRDTIPNDIKKKKDDDKFSKNRNIHDQFLFTHAILFVC